MAFYLMSMKRAGVFVMFGLFLTSTSVFGQGTVVFNNVASSTFNLYTNNASFTPGIMSGAGRYRIGLYATTNLSDPSGMQLVGLATNLALGGKFNGGSAYALPSGFPPGQPILFQLRAWNLNGGLSYQEAFATAAADPLSCQLGCSQLGITTPGGITWAPGPLFGNSGFLLSSGFLLGSSSGCPTNPPLLQPFSFSRSNVRGPGNSLTFNIQSQSGVSYQLYSSVDLATWTPAPFIPTGPLNGRSPLPTGRTAGSSFNSESCSDGKHTRARLHRFRFERAFPPS